jgi:undecaprenyl-phosphate 4-deoxy-4-formamido-L-arabinose transferase
MPNIAPDVTVVIPVFNEQEVLPALFARLYPALDALGRPYEIVFVNDGSRDRSAALLKTQFELRPEVTRVVLFSSNFGQHRAILAAFAHSRGRYVITLDADLQNPPEEIGRLLIELDAGHDYVGTIRIERQDVAWRRYASRLVNKIRERTTQVKITDQGSMFRGYSRTVVDAVNQCSEYNTFVPALAYTFSMNPTEIRVAHEERGAGKSKYSLFSLMRLNFDLMTGFSSAPMRLFSGIGIVIALL